MSATITITAGTTDDPYSAFWAGLSADDVGAVERYFTDSHEWAASSDPTDVRVSPLLAAIEVSGQPLRLYLATDPAAVDASADAVEAILTRAPDSLT